MAELNLRQRALAAEYSLARNSTPYLVVDLSGRSIALRARGRSLRVFTVADLDQPAHRAASVSVWSLKNKSPFEQTRRTKITPGQGDEAAAAAAKQALWGPDRMPADYDLICDGGKILEIRSLPSAESGSFVGRWTKSLYRRGIDHYRRLAGSWRSRKDFRIQLWLAESDSALLFWSLPKQFNILIFDGIPIPEAPPIIPAASETVK